MHKRERQRVRESKLRTVREGERTTEGDGVYEVVSQELATEYMYFFVN